MNKNHLYIDSYHKSREIAQNNAIAFSMKNHNQYYHIIPSGDEFKVSRYYDVDSLGCYFKGVFNKVN